MQRVARALSAEITLMTEGQIDRSLMDAMEHLHDRAAEELQRDSESNEARLASMQYLVVIEAIAMLGTQLIAQDDIESEEPEKDGGDPDSN